MKVVAYGMRNDLVGVKLSAAENKKLIAAADILETVRRTYQDLARTEDLEWDTDIALAAATLKEVAEDGFGWESPGYEWVENNG